MKYKEVSIILYVNDSFQIYLKKKKNLQLAGVQNQDLWACLA